MNPNLELPNTISNDNLVGFTKPTGVLSITWSKKHNKYTIRLIVPKDGINDEITYLGFIAPDKFTSTLWYIHTKLGEPISKQNNIHSAVIKVSKELLKVLGRVWVYTKTDNSQN